MEDRLRKGGDERLALLALGAIVAITVAWWVLALWPIDSPPSWIARTRSVCFGTGSSGLPDGGGWILLVGQPLGMMTFLFLVWGRTVTGGLRRMGRRRAGRFVLASIALLLLAGTAGALVRIGTASVAAVLPVDVAAPVRVDRPAPALALTDQAGRPFSLEQHRGERLLVTFAWAHCETVCPLTIRDVLAARAAVEREPPMVVVVTLDPWRDTPARLPSIARQWGLRTGDYVLSGDTAAVLDVLDRWNIPISRDPETGRIDHVGIVFVIDASGRITFAAPGDAVRLADLVRRS